MTLAQGRHETLIDILKKQNIESVSGLLADLGVSSMQLDDASRGFSFRYDAPLDMRMGPESKTAADLVNTLDEHELATILRDYGEEPMARRIAKAIVDRACRGADRDDGEAGGDREECEVVEAGTDRSGHAHVSGASHRRERGAGRTRPVHRRRGEVLEPGARIAIISFHSLEDRIVKRALRRLEGECTCPPNLPVCGCGAKEVVEDSDRPSGHCFGGRS